MTGISTLHKDFIKALLWAFIPGFAFICALLYQGLDSPLCAPILLPPILFGLGAAFLPGLRHGFSLPRNGLIFSLLAYAGYLILTPLWSPTINQSVLFLHIFLILPAMFFTLIMAQRARELTYACLLVFAAIFSVLLMWVFYQFFFLFDTYGPRIHDPFLNPNDLGTLLGLGVMISTAFFLQSPSKKIMIPALVFAVLLLAGVFMTQGRAILLALIICFTILVIMLRKEHDVLKFRAPVFAFLAVIIYVALDARLGLRIITGFDQLGQGIQNVSVDSRLLLWKSTIEMVRDHLWLGIGLGNFHYFYPQYRAPQDGSDGFFTHMDPLQFWAEGGILLPVLFYAVLVFVLLRTIKVMKLAPQGSQSRAVVGGTFCGLLAVLMHTHLSFDLYQPSLLLPMSVAFALWYIESERVLLPQRTFIKVSRNTPYAMAVCVIFTLCALASAVWVARTGAGLYFIQKLNTIETAQNKLASIPALKGAQFWAPDGSSLPYDYDGRLQVYYLENLAKGTPKSEIQDIYSKGVSSFAAARARDPFDPYARYYQAILYERGFEAGVDADGRNVASKLLRDLINDDPLMMAGRMGLATLHESDADPQGAFNVLNEGLTWPKPIQPIAVQYFLRLAEYYKNMGNKPMYDFVFNEARSWNQKLLDIKDKK